MESIGKEQVVRYLRNLADSIEHREVAANEVVKTMEIFKTNPVTKPETGDLIVDREFVGTTILIDIGSRPHSKIQQVASLLNADGDGKAGGSMSVTLPIETWETVAGAVFSYRDEGTTDDGWKSEKMRAAANAFEEALATNCRRSQTKCTSAGSGSTA